MIKMYPNSDMINELIEEVSPGATVLEYTSENRSIYIRFQPLVFDGKDYSKILVISLDEYLALRKQKQRKDNLKIIFNVPKD